VLFRLAYLLMIRVFDRLSLLARSDSSKDVASQAPGILACDFLRVDTHREREQLEMRCRALNTRVILAAYRRGPWGEVQCISTPLPHAVQPDATPQACARGWWRVLGAGESTFT
jgi:hypothetical protein